MAGSFKQIDVVWVRLKLDKPLNKWTFKEGVFTEKFNNT